MADYLWNTANEAAAVAIYGNFTNVIMGKGIPALPASEDLQGNVIPPTDAVGDPNRFYLNVRSSVHLDIPDGFEETDPELSDKIIGVWA